MKRILFPTDLSEHADIALPHAINLAAMEGGEQGQSYILGGSRVTIGRAAENTIHLMEEAVSRQHAEVVPGPDGYLLRDRGSENGTFVNGKRKMEHMLQEGDVIQIGIRKLGFHMG